jgi:two-component system response regulator RegX3
MFDVVQPDLVLLDVMLPGMSGIDVCRQIRQKSRTPVIMVTAKDSELDTVVGLEIGADDYITKPYRLPELIARIRAVLRRALSASVALSDEVVEIGDVRLDTARREVRVRGAAVTFPRKEFDLLEALMVNVGRVMTREALLDQVWGTDYVGDTKTLDVHIKRLRSKIEAAPSSPTKLSTVRGVGYRFETAEIEASGEDERA